MVFEFSTFYQTLSDLWKCYERGMITAETRDAGILEAESQRDRYVKLFDKK